MTQALIEKITMLCKKKGVSVNQMVTEVGVNKSLVDNLKKGSLPSVDKLLLVARYFGVSVDFLLGNENKEPTVLPVPDQTPEEILLLQQWRSHPTAQPFVRKLLDMPEPQSEGGAVS